MEKCNSCSSLLQGFFSWLNRRFKRSDSTCLKSIDKCQPSQRCFAHWNLQAGQTLSALVHFSRRTATWAPSDPLVSKEKSRGIHGSVSWAPNKPENPCLEGLGGPLTVQGSEHWSDGSLTMCLCNCKDQHLLIQRCARCKTLFTWSAFFSGSEESEMLISSD